MAKSPLAESSFIHVIARPGRYKIGTSISGEQRARDIIRPAGLNDAELHIALPVFSALPHGIEQEAHALLRAKRVEGVWFAVEPSEAADAIEWALVTVTRLAAVQPQRSGRNRRPLDASTLRGKAIIAARLAYESRTRDLRRDRPPSLNENPVISAGRDTGPLHQRARTRAKVSWPNWSLLPEPLAGVLEREPAERERVASMLARVRGRP
jgi:hypothetical protein